MNAERQSLVAGGKPSTWYSTLLYGRLGAPQKGHPTTQHMVSDGNGKAFSPGCLLTFVDHPPHTLPPPCTRWKGAAT